MTTNSRAQEIIDAYAQRRTDVIPFTSRDPAFDLSAGYAVLAKLTERRRRSGRRTVGRKVGFANRGLWRIHCLDSVAWAPMYDDTVHYADRNLASLAIGSMSAPKLEPEIIFKLRDVPAGNPDDPVAALESVEWLALGFEIVDCVYADWKFQPADFVAAYGLHAALIVGDPTPVQPAMLPGLAAALATVEVRLLKHGTLIAEGSGANVLKNPALCLGELAAGIARQEGADPLAAGELIATGALTANQYIAVGETWTATLRGLELPDLTLRLTA